MTPIATVCASVCFLFVATPAMAQMHGGGGGGGHGAVHVAGGGFAHHGPAGHFDVHGAGFHDHNHGQRGRHFWPYGGYAYGYGYPWYFSDYSDDYVDDEENADAPEPAPAAPAPPAYRRHDPNGCSEWSWDAGHHKYVCTRRAG